MSVAGSEAPLEAGESDIAPEASDVTSGGTARHDNDKNGSRGTVSQVNRTARPQESSSRELRVQNGDKSSRKVGNALVQRPADFSKGALVSVEDTVESSDFHVSDTLVERPGGPIPLKDFLAERSREVFDLIAPLEAEIKKVGRFRRGSPRLKKALVVKVAELVVSILRQIAQRETGLYLLEPDIASLCAALFSGPAEGAVLEGLLHRASVVLATLQKASLSAGTRSLDSSGEFASRQIRSVIDGYDVAREVEELTMLLRWYVRRRTSIAILEWQNLFPEYAAGDLTADDAIFGVEVLHDQSVFGTKGCVVTCGLRLIGHDGQALWVRVMAESMGQLVSVRQGWDSWVDVADESHPYDDLAPFSALVPVRPNAQRVVIDEVRVFVPYGAFDLPSGRTTIDLTVSLIGAEGETLLQSRCSEEICVPHHGDRAVKPLSPHAIGMWPHDVVSGDKVSNLIVSSGYSQLSGWEQLTINVSCDLSLFQHAGEPVLIECRFSDSSGDLVEVTPLALPVTGLSSDHDGELTSYRVRRVLRPRTAWANYSGLSFEVPVEFLQLAPGSHDLGCELAVLSADDRVLCGDLATVRVVIPTPRGATASLVPDVVRPGLRGGGLGGDPGVELESLEVNPTWRFRGSECIRVQATCCLKGVDTATNRGVRARGENAVPYRVVVSLEHGDGTLFLQEFSDDLGITFRPASRSVCVEGHLTSVEQSVVCNFSHAELLWTPTGGDARISQGKAQVIVRVRGLTLDGEIFLDETKEIFVKPDMSGERMHDVHLRQIHAVFVDVVASTYLQSKKFSSRVLLNLPCQVAAREGVTLVAYLLAGAESAGMPSEREPFKHKVNPRHVALWGRSGLELVQVPVEFEGVLPGTGETSSVLRLELRSEYGEVVERLDHRILPQRPSTVEMPASGSPRTPSSLNEVRSGSEGLPESGSEPEPQSRRGKGVLWWLKSS